MAFAVSPEGKAIFIGIFVFLATCFSIGSVSWCETAGFTLNGPEGHHVAFGIWWYNTIVLVSQTSSAGTALWAVETCRAYPGAIQLDSAWQAARAFSIIAPIWGAIIAPLPMCILSISHELAAKATGLLLMLATMFQAFTLLLLQSKICDAKTNPFFGMFPVLQANGAITTSDMCNLGPSGIISIVAACLYFVAGLVAVAVPTDPTKGGDLDGDANPSTAVTPPKDVEVAAVAATEEGVGEEGAKDA